MLILFCLLCRVSYTQTLVSILPDSTIRIFTDQDLKLHRDRCAEGLQFLINDTNKSIIVELHIKQCKLNGIYRRFYENNSIMELGNYINDKKDGIFFFWDKNGFLRRKEIWKMNKLTKSIRYSVASIEKE